MSSNQQQPAKPQQQQQQPKPTPKPATNPKPPTKPKKAKKKKLTKEERIALRQAQQKAAAAKKNKVYVAPVLRHPDDGDFGDLQFNQSQYRTRRTWMSLQDLNQTLNGKEVWIRGRVDTIRAQGKKMVFLNIRRSFCKIQAVINSKNKEIIKYVTSIAPESIIDIFGVVVVVKDKIDSASPDHLKDIEIAIKKIYTVCKVEAPELPFQINDATRPDIDDDKNNNNNDDDDDANKKKLIHVGQAIRLDNRWIDLRVITNHAIFRIQAGVCKFFRDFLWSKGFIEIHSPKLISAASEGGANVFKLKYFGKDAFLAQSPQLYKQMALCSDLFKVFEIGPVFRAEDSNTHRHLCEFTGMDLEMEFMEHYHEVLAVIGELFVYIFQNIRKHFKYELETINKQYPFTPLKYNKKLLILTFKEAKEMTQKYYDELIKKNTPVALKEAKELRMGLSKDFSTPEEKLLGKLVLKKYKTQFYCVDKYPITARPFYTMIDPYNPDVSNSYDFFIRGEEIISGAQRIHDTKMLVERANYHKVPLHTIQPYIDSFKYATSPHAGCGIGLERVVMLFLGLDNIRKASLFPRDPQRCEP